MVHETGENSSSTLSSEMVGPIEAARIVGVAYSTWSRWQREGGIGFGTWADPLRQNWRRGKVYAVADVMRLREELRRSSEPRPDPERPGCYRIPVAYRGKPRFSAIVDTDALPLVAGKRWKVLGQAMGSGLVVAASEGEGTGTAMWRIVAGEVGRHSRVRHVNGDPLDCRRANLIVSGIEEGTSDPGEHGAVKRRASSSRFKGVCRGAKQGTWRATIHVNNTRLNLGQFESEIAAAEAYDAAAREMLGEDARVNFPRGGDCVAARRAA